jgi:hypothetical protein
MSYSYLTIHVLGPTLHVPAIDIHLAYSDDGGKTWHYQGPLWPSQQGSDQAGDTGSGYTAHEVSNILPVKTKTGVTWYGVRLSYFVPSVGNYKNRRANSFRLEISQAASPQALSSAPAATLGDLFTSAKWGVDTRLSSLSPDVSNCGIAAESALYYQNNTLYLTVECQVFSGNQGVINNDSIVVFATQPSGDVHTWKWRYAGRLAGSKEAKALSKVNFTQVEIAKGSDGHLLAIFTPDSFDPTRPGFIDHAGCWVVEVASLNPPRVALDASGKPKIRAIITASDLGVQGPGSCTYDPASATGIIIARRHLNEVPVTSSLNATGIRP